MGIKKGLSIRYDGLCMAKLRIFKKTSFLVNIDFGFSDPGSSVLEIARREKGRLLSVGSSGDLPQKWIEKVIRFPNGKVAFEIGKP